MHILGKILTWTLFVVAGTSTVLMARQLQIRNSYTDKLDDLKRDNRKNAQIIEEKEEELRRLNVEYERIMAEQQSYWDNRTGLINPAAGTIGLGVGRRDGVGRIDENANPPVKVRRREQLHLFFRPDRNDPQTVYVGPFRLSTNPAEIGDRSVTVYPAWNLRPGELQRWEGQAGGNVWRVRSTVPSRYPSAFKDKYLLLESIERELASVADQKVRATKQKESAEAEVIRYRKRITGDADNVGLVARLQKAEEDRNAVLVVVDGLRRRLKQMVDRRKMLEQENRRLVQQMFQSADNGSSKTPPPKPLTAGTAKSKK